MNKATFDFYAKNPPAVITGKWIGEIRAVMNVIQDGEDYDGCVLSRTVVFQEGDDIGRVRAAMQDLIGKCADALDDGSARWNRGDTSGTNEGELDSKLHRQAHDLTDGEALDAQQNVLGAMMGLLQGVLDHQRAHVEGAAVPDSTDSAAATTDPAPAA